MKATVALNRLLVKPTLPEQDAVKRTPYSNDRILYLNGGDLILTMFYEILRT